MKKLLIVVCIVVLAFSGCSSSNEKDGKPSDIPYSRIEFEILEENSEYVGTYWIKRSNQFTSWEEWGEWTKCEYTIDNILGQATVCFGSFPPENKASFFAKEGYLWGECRSGGRDCLCLKKK